MDITTQVGGVEHVATVAEKELALTTYEDAQRVGIGAGLVTRDTEDTSLFNVATNVEAGQQVQ